MLDNASTRRVVLGSLGVDFGELGAFEGDVRHEPLDVEDERDDRVLHLGEVDALAAADVHQGHVAVETDLPSLAGLKLLQGRIRHEKDHKVFGFAADLEPDRPGGEVVIGNVLSLR